LISIFSIGQHFQYLSHAPRIVVRCFTARRESLTIPTAFALCMLKAMEIAHDGRAPQAEIAAIAAATDDANGQALPQVQYASMDVCQERTL
jgi:hypothetical protein